MIQLQKIYDGRSEEQNEYALLKKEWANLVTILYEQCAEDEREAIMSIVLEYGVKIEKYAFMAGYKKSFRLFLDILKN